jgi:hypothetical protein
MDQVIHAAQQEREMIRPRDDETREIKEATMNLGRFRIGLLCVPYGPILVCLRWRDDLGGDHNEKRACRDMTIMVLLCVVNGLTSAAIP